MVTIIHQPITYLRRRRRRRRCRTEATLAAAGTVAGPRPRAVHRASLFRR